MPWRASASVARERGATTAHPAAIASRMAGPAASSAVAITAIAPGARAAARDAGPSSGTTSTRSRSALGTAARVRQGASGGPTSVTGPTVVRSSDRRAPSTKRTPARSRPRATRVSGGSRSARREGAGISPGSTPGGITW